MSRVATIVLNWNNGADTLECLESLERVQRTGWTHEIVVVDNASTDGSPDEIQARFPEVTLLRSDENLGFTGGCNVGIRRALESGADYVVLLNNDTVVEPTAYDRLVTFARARARLGAVTPLIRFHDGGGVWHAGARVIRPFGRVSILSEPISSLPYQVELFTGCCVLLPRRALEEIGFLDERYFAYQEDSDLSLRLAERGYERWVLPEAVIYHKVSRTIGGPDSPNALYYTVRNNLLLIQSISRSGAERALGYAYMVALTAKISMNAFTRRFPDKRGTFLALADGWGDFARARWGGRSR